MPLSPSDPTPTSATLSLLELRRHLLRRASVLGVRARALRARGDHAAAARLGQEAARILQIAKKMGADSDTEG